MSNITQSIMLWKNANLSLAFTDHCSRFVQKLETVLELDINDFVNWCDATEASTMPVFSDLEEAINVARTWLEFNAGEAVTVADKLEVASFVNCVKYEIRGIVIQRLKRIAA